MCIIVVFCTLTSASRENFCVHVHAQKFLIVILDNKVFQLWIICANTQIHNRDVDFCAYAQKFQITICIIPYRYVRVGRSKIIFRNICVRTQNTSMSLGICSYAWIIQRWKAKIILGISAYVCRIHIIMYLGTCSYTQIIHTSVGRSKSFLGMSAYIRRMRPCLWVLAHMRK